jgi:hypothetical protein
MNRKKRLFRLSVFATVLLFGGQSFAAAKPIDYCKSLAKTLLQKPDRLDFSFLGFYNAPTCFFQASLSNEKANQALSPIQTTLWNAFESYSASQQQGSNLSSSGSTNAVSKPSGPTALAEEFGGANVTKGTSSTTVQWSPGKMLTNLALTNVIDLCLVDKKPKACISPTVLQALVPLTFKVTANTSNGTPSVSGSATNSTSSTSSAQQVNVNSQGAKGPNFAGLTAQYSFFQSRGGAAVKSSTNYGKSPAKQGTPSAAESSALQYLTSKIEAAETVLKKLKGCSAYGPWTDSARKALQAKIPNAVPQPSSAQIAQIQDDIETQYADLQEKMLNDKTCQDALDSIGDFYAAISKAKAYDIFEAEQSSSGKPQFTLEYDLNTPQNKPSYSSAKATFDWQFGKKTVKPPSDPTNPKSFTPHQRNVENLVGNQISKARQGSSAKTSPSEDQDAKNLAQDTSQPFSLTITGTADIYHTDMSSTVPSASHLRDIQAGAEIAWVFTPFGKTSVWGKTLGSATLAGAYSYEDQTSPAILTGPALSDFTGLPSSTTAAYAQRGVIHLAQVRLGFGTGKNMTFPIAATYSNRTELITHPTWGLQFGITYNFTSLFSSGSNNSGN